MAFHDVRLPEQVEQGSKGGPAFQTSIVALSSGAEQRNACWELPLTKWDISYGIDGRDDFEEVRDFFYARMGKLHSFRFKDWGDFAATDEACGTGDGTTRNFLLKKTYVSGSAEFVRRITRPILSTLSVKVDGVAVDPADYDASDEGGWIRFHSGHAPANAAAVTATFEFDIPVRFDVDQFTLTMMQVDAGGIEALPVVEVRDNVNAAPVAVTFENTTSSLPENTDTTSRVHLADVAVDDDPFGTNVLTLSGAESSNFELVGSALYLRAGVVLNYEADPSLAVTVSVDDATVGDTPDATATFTLTVTDVDEAPSIVLGNFDKSLADGTSTAAHVRVADFSVSDDALGSESVTLTGADASDFEIVGGSIYIKAGTDGGTLTNAHKSTYTVVVEVDDATLTPHPQDSETLVVTVGVVPATTDFTTSGAYDYTVPFYNTLTITLDGAGGGGCGFDAAGTDGGATTLPGKSLSAGGGKAPALNTTLANYVIGNPIGGAGGTATGGDTDTDGNQGGNGVGYGLRISAGVTTPPSGKGADAPGGALGGAGVTAVAVSSLTDANHVDGTDGADPGAGGAGSMSTYGFTPSIGQGIYYMSRPGGGSGSRLVKTYTYGVTPGYPSPGDHLTGSVGAKGVGGQSFADGGDGGKGRVRFVVA